ncbi:MAG: chromosome partitioning protein ParA [Gammaproteobacteria bacterium]|nr:chromosome partitioning protein ParA [Gammaproteobacteria bacterium]MBU2407298.1 chromosome partitioning protein ParA [Gammaproteobacteria bacterium]
MKPRARSSEFRRPAGWLIGVALLLAGWQASAQDDPPGRVARLNFHQGTVSFSPAGDDSWYDVVPNRPMTRGDRVWTDRNARAEVHLGSAALRMDEQTSVALDDIDDEGATMTALQGSVQLRVRDDGSGVAQRFEVDTPNLAVAIETPGDFRIDVDPATDTTRIAVASGSVTLLGEGGESIPLGGRQQITVSGRNLAAVSGSPVRAGAAFDRWVAERDRVEDQSIAARYVSREVVGYQALDAYGDWQNESGLGNVWYPHGVDADWAPYRDGQWVNVAPWGWTWVDAAPWGFAPSHYGRWARVGSRWGWVPGPRQARPVFAPALVGFVGGNPGAQGGLPIGGGRNGVGWFPLAPGEAWRPGFRASDRYIDNANRSAALGSQWATREPGYAHRNTPGAVTVVPMDAFGRGPVSRRDFVRLPQDRTAAIPVGVAAPVPLRGERPVDVFGRPVGAAPPASIGREPRNLPRSAAGFERRQEPEGWRQQQFQQPFQQRAAQEQAQQSRQAQQMLQAQQAQQIQQQQLQQQMVNRQQQDMQQRAAQAQAQQQFQMQQQNAQRQQQMQQQQQAQQVQQLQLQQQALRAQQQMQAQQAQQQMQVLQQQQAMRQAQEAQQAQQRAVQQQQQLQLQQQQIQQQQQQRAQRFQPGQSQIQLGGGPRAPGLPRNEPLGIGDRP